MAHNSNDFLQALVGKQRNLPTPTALSIILNGAPHQIGVLSILRLLPGKRVVFCGRLGDQLVAVKFFIKTPSSARHIQRERAGYARVQKAGIVSPALIGHCISACGQFEGLIYEFIDEAIQLVEHWPTLNEQQKRFWLQQVVMTALQLHREGAYQADIHLGNFLIKNNQLYLLDLGSIVIRNEPLSKTESLANLGQLIAQLDVGEQALLDQPIDFYFNQRDWTDSAALKTTLQRMVRKAWRYRLRDYLGKAQRDCSLTAFEKKFDRVFAFRRHWQSADLQRFADDPEQFMVAGQILKAGNTATVVKATLDGKTVVIKRYNIKNWRHAISRSLRPTRAEHSWRTAHLLELIGIDSLKPIALLERRCGPLRGTAYFISGWIDAPDLLTVATQRQLNSAELVALQSLLLQMITCRLSHGDFKANNLLVDGEHIAVIDLDAMQRYTHREPFQQRFQKDLARLQRNWPADSAVFKQVQTVIGNVLALQQQQKFYL